MKYKTGSISNIFCFEDVHYFYNGLKTCMCGLYERDGTKIVRTQPTKLQYYRYYMEDGWDEEEINENSHSM